jgi:hypothetical protein
MIRRRLVALLFAGALVIAAPTAAATATPLHPNPHKCNAGNGNQSETDPSNDCDPGNSGGNNNGGD